MCVRGIGQADKHLTKSYLQGAREAGIDIKRIKLDEPLEQQGPFHAILHKAHRNKGMHKCLIHVCVNILHEITAMMELLSSMFKCTMPVT